MDEDLVEWFYGDYEGRTSVDIRGDEPEWTIWRSGAPNGESVAEVGARLARVAARVRASGVDQAICFAHGHALRALTMVWLGFDIGLGGQFPLDTSTVSLLGEAKGQPALHRWNARP